MSFCVPHKVSLVLAVEGIPVSWETLKVPKASGSCPLCRATRDGNFHATLKKWIEKGRANPEYLLEQPKVSENSTDKESVMDYKTQQKNKEKLREESNRKIVSGLTKGKSPRLPSKKPNHLRIV